MALIEIEQLTKSFLMGDERVTALSDVSFKVDEREFVSITGPSGCGKSTLMNILGLLDLPDSGKYLLNGKPVESLADDEAAELRNRWIGFVFQNFNLLPRLSALRNVEMPLVYASREGLTKTARLDRAKQALREVGLSDRMNHAPNELSGGQRQRVAIARALINRPRLLLADEPTGNLDSKSGKEILKLFQKLNQDGVTIVMVTHDPNIAKESRRVISMLDGRIQSDAVQ